MLTRIRNAKPRAREGRDAVAPKLKVEIARILKHEGYIDDYAVARRATHSQAHASCSSTAHDRKRVITGIQRISKPGRRVYAKSDRLPQGAGRPRHRDPVDPEGVMTEQRGRRARIGGEVLCYVW